MYTFKLKKECFFNPEIGNYCAYSVEVYDENHSSAIACVSDVFTDYEKAQEFVRLLNLCQPEPVHLEELCIDFIQ